LKCYISSICDVCCQILIFPLLPLLLLLLQSRGVDVDSAKEAGMAEMSEVFKAAGAEVYLPADEEQN
jgi:hypothetical protein